MKLKLVLIISLKSKFRMKIGKHFLHERFFWGESIGHQWYGRDTISPGSFLLTDSYTKCEFRGWINSYLHLKLWVQITGVYARTSKLLFTNMVVPQAPAVCIGIRVTPYERHGVSNYRKLDCLFNSLFKLTRKETSKLRITDLLWKESQGDRWDSLHKGPVMAKSFQCSDSIILVLLCL